MDMSVSATGSSALREYQTSAAGAAFPEAAQKTLAPPTKGTQVSSLPGVRKLSNEEMEALTTTNLNFTRESLDPKELNNKFAAMATHLLAMQEYGNAMSEYGTAMSEYGTAMSKRAEDTQQKMQGFFSKMQKELGGAQTAMAIPNDPLGTEPVRTSSGAIHPQSQRIKDYIRTHKNEWDSFSSPEPSFEEWQQTRV